MSSAPNRDRVKQVFQEVLEQPEPERAARVRELCGSDLALQAEVESLLITHDRAGSFDELRQAMESATGRSGSTRLRAGDRLGVYEIQSLAGAGGMGEVYKARDTRLDRIVAIKVLPGALAADRDRYVRFEREARAVARLDHPHIGALFDVGEHEGLHFLVMQYLEGETLAARLVKGPIPLADALRYAVEILEALDHAHRRGIVHRDLKPGNIVLTRNGATLLDFGLAKGRATPVGSAGVSTATIRPDSLTEAGMIVGTLHYMAPEQVEGKDADARSDLFAFGAVAYEMLTGKKAFAGGSAASVMAAILGTPPGSLSAMHPLPPPALEHVVMTCLAKDPDARWQSASDVARQLRWIAESDTQTQPVSAPAGVRSDRRTVLTVGLVALLTGCVIGGAAAWRGVRSRDTTALLKVTRSVIPLPSGARLSGDSLLSAVAISPDGRTIAFTADVGSGSQLYARALDSLVAAPIVGTSGASAPFFSPDGHWLGFNVGGQIEKVAISGGAPQVVCEAAGRSAFGAAWAANGTILFSGRPGAGLSRVSANGGAPVIVTTPDVNRREKSHRRAAPLPDGKSVLMTVGTADISSFDDARIDVLTLATGERKTVIQGGMDARYVSTGHLLYAHAGSLLAVPFDLGRLEATGPPATVVSDVFTQPDFGYANFAVSRDGSLLYMPGGTRPWQTTLMWVDRQGRSQPVTDVRRAFDYVSLSPDGGRIALQIDQATVEVWIYDIARTTFTRLVHGWDNGSPIWSRDGGRITFESTRSTAHGVFSQSADGTGNAERLTPDVLSAQMIPGAWSPDGRQLVFTQYNARFDTDLWVWSAADHRARPLLQTPASESDAGISPDGRWMAYQSNQSGRFEVYVQAFPGPSRSWPVSPDGGTNPVWSRNGRELFYRNGNVMMAVDVVATPTFAAGRPKRLFEGSYLRGAYDVARDGRFLMIKDEPEPLGQLNLVQNWFEELKRRVPTP